MKNTKQREIILTEVLNSCNHPSADIIYHNVREKIPNISLGTVYRNLNFLSEEGLIKKIPVSYGSDRFDKTLTDHYHMNCIKCNNCIDVMDVKIINIDEFEKSTKNKILTSDVVFYGLCKKCKGEEN